MRSEHLVADRHTFEAGDVSSRLPLVVVAASITALRSGSIAPELIWTPGHPCCWQAQIAVRRPYDDAHADKPFEDLLWSQNATAPRSGVETVLTVEHGSRSLADVMHRAGERPLRVMVWTLDHLCGYPCDAGQWTRLTLDDAHHMLTVRRSGRWVSTLVSPVPSPTVDVSDIIPSF